MNSGTQVTVEASLEKIAEPKYEWAVETKTFSDGDFDRRDDGKVWVQRRGEGYTEEEARAALEREQRRLPSEGGPWVRLVRREVTDWQEVA